MLLFLKKLLWDVWMWQYKPRSSNSGRQLHSQELCSSGGRKQFLGLRLTVFYYNHGKNVYEY